MPQVEQFGVTLRPCGSALVGESRTELAEARVCVYRVGELGVVTSHRIRVLRDMPFLEGGSPGVCVATLCPESLALCPVSRPARVRGAGNVAVFGQDGLERSCVLRAGSAQDSVSVTLLPEWFARMGAADRAAARAIAEGVGETCPDEVAAPLDALLRSVSPLFGGTLADGRRLAGLMGAVARSTLDWHEGRERAEAAAGTLAQARLVRAAKRHVLRHLDAPLSLDALARDLLTSRSRLCAAFRAETGESLGAYVARMRVERAEELLRVGSLSVGEVARAVGYPRASSFTVAFERARGCSPSAWRAAGA